MTITTSTGNSTENTGVSFMSDILDKAILFAVKAHSGMLRKGTCRPYILHPLEAAAIVGSMTADEEVVAAAVLHDVLEDTPVSAQTLLAVFGDRITRLVQSESEDKRADLPAAETWKIRKQETIDALMKETSIEVKMLALGDKLSNLRAMYNDHQKIGDTLWARFNQKNKSEHGWYYRSIAVATKELAAFPAWQEYDRLVVLVFGNQQNGDIAK
jgi:myo-inositol-1(or 4)-monophosphatase